MNLDQNSQGIYIRYKPYEGINALSLSAVGNSLITFETIVQKAFKISKIEGDLDAKIVHVEDGSIIIDIGINVILALGSIGFASIEDYLNLLVITNYDEYKELVASAEIFTDKYNSLENFFADRPIAYDLTKLVGGIILAYIFVGGQIKNNQTTNIYNQTIINQNIIQIDQSTYLTKEQLEKIEEDYKKGTFNDLVAPIVEDEVEAIEFGIKNDDEREVIKKIDANNFENYLSEGKEILPEYEDGNTYRFQGRIVSMQIAHGETMGFKSIIGEKSYYLVSKVTDDTSIEEHKHLFNQEVYVEAQVQRESLYKKPRLIISSITLVNQPLFKDLQE